MDGGFDWVSLVIGIMDFGHATARHAGRNLRLVMTCDARRLPTVRSRSAPAASGATPQHPRHPALVIRHASQAASAFITDRSSR